jgi:Skp family chaperone for outer membrane proteins
MGIFRFFAATVFSIVLLLSVATTSLYAEGEVSSSVDSLTQTLSKIDETSIELDAKLQALQTQLNKLLNPETSALQKQLVKVADVISRNKGNSDISSQVTTLHRAIISYRQDLNEEEYIGSLFDELSEHFDAPTKELNDDLFNELTKTLIVLENVEAQRAVTAVTRRAARLNDLLAQTRRITNGNHIVSELETLQTTLQTVEANDFFTALNNRIARLKEQLEPNAVVLGRLRQSDQKALHSLIAEINKVLPQNQKVGTHVVSAYWGRLSGPQSAGGVCDVTTAMRKTCEGKPTCQLPTNWPSQFCGGRDPAPFAESIHKGLLLRYICLSADGPTWNAVLAGRTTLSTEEKRLTAVLRNAGDQVHCEKPD